MGVAKLKINWRVDDQVYIYVWPSFCWLDYDETGTLTQIDQWATCREQHINKLKNYICSKTSKNKEIISGHRVLFGIKRILGRPSKQKENEKIRPQDKIFTSHNNKATSVATRVLNLIEEKAGWGLTAITKYKRDVKDKTISHTYVVDAPREWFESIPMLSLYLLIMRSCWFVDFFKIKKIEDIEKACKKLIKRAKKDSTLKNHLRRHIEFINTSYAYWWPLILNKDLLIGDRSTVRLYEINTMYAGMQALVQPEVNTVSTFSVDKVTRNNWEEIIKKHKKGDHD